MKRKMLVIGIGIVSLVLLLTLPLMAASTPAPATKVIKWRMQSFLVPTSGSGWDVTVRFTQKVKEMSGGRLEIEVYPSGALVGTMQMLEAVGKGMVEAGTGGPIYWTGTLPVLALADVPMTMGSVNHNEAAHLWWNMGLIDVMRAEYAKAKVFLVGPIMCTVYGETMSKKPIRTLADFKGLKLRSFGMVGDLWKAFGASIVSVTIPEMYTALATGTIDAANVSGLSGFYTYKLHEVAKYAIGPPVLDSIRNDFFVNMDKWKALPPDLQQIVITAARAWSAERDVLDYTDNAKALSDLKAAGVTYITLPDRDVAELRKVALRFLDEKAKRDAASAKAAELIKKAMKLYGYID